MCNRQYEAKYNSPMGTIKMISDGEYLTGLWLEGQNYIASKIGDIEEKKLEVFTLTKSWLDIYFKGLNPSFLPPMRLEGSEFAKDVWQILLNIPYGQLMTYGDIALIMAKKYNKTKMSAQAVGGAVGHNPVSIIVPCHRVVGRNGNLTGYAGGIDKKVQLLKLEQVDWSKLYMPKIKKRK